MIVPFRKNLSDRRYVVVIVIQAVYLKDVFLRENPGSDCIEKSVACP